MWPARRIDRPCPFTVPTERAENQPLESKLLVGQLLQSYIRIAASDVVTGTPGYENISTDRWEWLGGEEGWRLLLDQ